MDGYIGTVDELVFSIDIWPKEKRTEEGFEAGGEAA